MAGGPRWPERGPRRLEGSRGSRSGWREVHGGWREVHGGWREVQGGRREVDGGWRSSRRLEGDGLPPAAVEIRPVAVDLFLTTVDLSPAAMDLPTVAADPSPAAVNLSPAAVHLPPAAVDLPPAAVGLPYGRRGPTSSHLDPPDTDCRISCYPELSVLPPWTSPSPTVDISSVAVDLPPGYQARSGYQASSRDPTSVLFEVASRPQFSCNRLQTFYIVRGWVSKTCMCLIFISVYYDQVNVVNDGE